MSDVSDWLDVETEISYIAVFHDVILSFEADQAFFFGSLFTAAGDEVVVRDDFSANEAPFDVGVDLAGSFLAFVPLTMVQARTSSAPAVKKLISRGGHSWL